MRLGNYHLWLLLGLILVIIGLTGSVVTPSSMSSVTTSDTSITSHRWLPLSRMLDFSHFKRTFKKTYASVVEEVARKKIFLARAMKAFLSFIGYRRNKSNSYLKINHMSDWTKDEADAVYKRHPRVSILEHIPVANSDESLVIREKKNVDKERRIISEVKLKHQLDGSNLSFNHLTSLTENEHSDYNRIISEQEGLNRLNLKTGLANDDSDLQEIIPSRRVHKHFKTLVSSARSYLFGAASKNAHYESISFQRKNKLIIDHRDCLPPPKNQRSCASCYIFAATALYEWNYCREHNGEQIEFSDQFALDCGDRVGLQGCAGDHLYKVGGFYGKYGLEMSKNYPYRAQSDLCPYEAQVQPEVMGFYKLGTNERGAMVGVLYDYLERFIKHTPIAMDLGVSAHFGQYGGGIDDGSACDLERGHSMVIVGMGIENGVEYWLFRNSFGRDWGEAGHYRLAKSASKKCLYNDGIGVYLQTTKQHSKIFKPQINYTQKAVEKRLRESSNNLKIAHNPIEKPKLNVNVVANKL